MTTNDDPYAFHRQIVDAAEASGLLSLTVKGEPPTAQIGPNGIDIAFNIDQTVTAEWDTLIVTPSDDEPPVWLVRLVNTVDGEQISSSPDPDSEVPSHRSLDNAMMIVAEKLAQSHKKLPH